MKRSRDNVKNELFVVIKKVKKDNLVADKEMKYFDSFYSNLSDSEYIARMDEVILSYYLMKDISCAERKSFVDGMISYLDFSLIMKDEPDFETIPDDIKMYIALNISKDRMELAESKKMYYKGVAAAIVMENNIKRKKKEKSSKVRKLN